MKNFLLISLFILFSFHSSSQAQSRVLELSGSIANQYPFQMVLNIQDSTVVGYYFYRKYKTKILLEGKRNGSSITLAESPEPGFETQKEFVGELKDNGFTGNWINNIQDKKLAFNASIDSRKELEISDKVKNIIGHYISNRNSEDFLGSADIRFITGNIFAFELSTASQRCLGDAKGVIKLKNFTKGTFSNKHCEKLDFTISSQKLIIKEKGKCLLHGMGCTFQGKYLKK